MHWGVSEGDGYPALLRSKEAGRAATEGGLRGCSAWIVSRKTSTLVIPASGFNSVIPAKLCSSWGLSWRIRSCSASSSLMEVTFHYGARHKAREASATTEDDTLAGGRTAPRSFAPKESLILGVAKGPRRSFFDVVESRERLLGVAHLEGEALLQRSGTD